MDAIKVKLIGLSRGGGGNLQPDKTATPTKQDQTVRADPGYDGLRQVTVEAIPDQYADVSGVDAGAGDVRVGKVIVGSDGETIIGTMPSQKPEEIGHATPTEQAQTVTPTAGSVFSAVEVDAIPSEYADVSGVDATAADVRTGKIIVDAQGDTVTGVMEPQKPEQVKTATPTTSPQSVTPDTGYALSRVDVGAIPSEYADVSDVTATAGTVLTGSDFVDASGTLVHGACDYDADTSDADATAGQIEAGATAYVGGAKVIGTMPVRSADVEIDSLSPVPIPAGSYDGTARAKIDDAEAAKIVPENIRKDVDIFGQVGTYEGVDTLKALNANTLTEYSDSSVTNIRDYLFCNNTALQSASFPNATTMGGNVFQDCRGLTEIDLPNLTTMGGNVFHGCSGLTEIDLPNLTTMGGLIGNATNVTSLNLPKLLATPNWGLAGLSNITRIDLPSLTDCGDNTFRNLQKLEVVTMMSVTVIRGTAFYSATRCATIVLGADTVCTLMSSSGLPPVALLTVYIKESLYNHLGDGTSLDYKSATNWSVYDAQGKIAWAKIEGSPYEVTT